MVFAEGREEGRRQQSNLVHTRGPPPGHWDEDLHLHGAAIELELEGRVAAEVAGGQPRPGVRARLLFKAPMWEGGGSRAETHQSKVEGTSLPDLGRT